MKDEKDRRDIKDGSRKIHRTMDEVFKAARIVIVMQEAQQAMRNIFGAGYPAKVAEFKGVVAERMRSRGLELMPAVIELAKENQGNGVVVGLLMSAALEVRAGRANGPDALGVLKD